MTRALRVLTLVVLGAAGTLTPAWAQTAPRLSGDWKRVQSKNFTVVGNAGERSLRSTARELEAFRHAMVSLFPALNTPAPVPTVFVLFSNVNAFRPFLPRNERGKKETNVAGYFTGGPDTRYMVAYQMTDGGDTLSVVFHEYAHALIRQSGRRVPTWVNEGLAEFYSTFHATANGGVVGAFEPDSLRMIASGEPLLSFEEMFTPEGVAKTFRNEVQAQRFYAEAWALVHYSILGDRQGQLAAYLDAIGRGATPAAAFTEAYKTNYTDLLLELRKYSRRPVMQALNLTLPAAEGTIGAADKMTEADALQVQAALLERHGADDEAAKLLAQARASDPANVGARVTSAVLDARHERRAEAIATLRQVTADAPMHFPARYWLARFLSDSGDEPGAIEAWSAATSLNPRSAESWAGLSLATGLQGRNAQSTVTLDRALGLEPDGDWLYMRSLALFGRNDALVVGDATRYLRERGSDDSAPYVAFLGSLAARRQKDAAASTALLAPLTGTLDAASWQAAVTRFLKGEVPVDALLQRATTAGERTEAHAYIGLVASIDGRLDEARQHLQWVRDQGSRGYTEYGLAIRELARIEAGVYDPPR